MSEAAHGHQRHEDIVNVPSGLVGMIENGHACVDIDHCLKHRVCTLDDCKQISKYL